MSDWKEEELGEKCVTATLTVWAVLVWQIIMCVCVCWVGDLFICILCTAEHNRDSALSVQNSTLWIVAVSDCACRSFQHWSFDGSFLQQINCIPCLVTSLSCSFSPCSPILGAFAWKGVRGNKCDTKSVDVYLFFVYYDWEGVCVCVCGGGEIKGCGTIDAVVIQSKTSHANIWNTHHKKWRATAATT